MGRSESYTVNVPNGDVVYSVFWSRDKLAKANPVEAGVSVEINGNPVATVVCMEKTIRSNLVGVQLRAEDQTEE